jgi:hypothetical protein
MYNTARRHEEQLLLIDTSFAHSIPFCFTGFDTRRPEYFYGLTRKRAQELLWTRAIINYDSSQ